MAYTPDRYKDRLIVAQTSAKIAADLYVAQDGINQDATVVERYSFQDWHKLVFDSTFELVGEDSFAEDARVAEAAAEAALKAAFPNSHTESASERKKPYADFQLKFGKYKGLTLQQIDNAVGDDGKTGHSYLQWLAQNKDSDDFIKTSVIAFLNG